MQSQHVLIHGKLLSFPAKTMNNPEQEPEQKNRSILHCRGQKDSSLEET